MLVQYIRQNYNLSNLVVVSPDAGGVERARAYAKRLDLPLAIIDKRRIRPNEAEAMNLIGDVKGRHAILVDDMIDTAGTLVQGVQVLKRFGATAVSAACTHGVFSGPAPERLRQCEGLTEVICTDTIPLSSAMQQVDKVRVLSVATILAETIRRIHSHQSVSSLFD